MLSFCPQLLPVCGVKMVVKHRLTLLADAVLHWFAWHDVDFMVILACFGAVLASRWRVSCVGWVVLQSGLKGVFSREGMLYTYSILDYG